METHPELDREVVDSLCWTCHHDADNHVYENDWYYECNVVECECDEYLDHP